MIYCFGLREKYDARLAAGPLYKYGRGIVDGSFTPGGAVFRTPTDVKAFLSGAPDEGASRGIYGVEADWEHDTVQMEGEPFRRLNRTARVVALSLDIA